MSVALEGEGVQVLTWCGRVLSFFTAKRSGARIVEMIGVFFFSFW